MTGPASLRGNDWSCVAYGPELPDICFFDQVADVCPSIEFCQVRMEDQRKVLFQRIQELAAHGDPVMEQLSQNFTVPSDLLNPTEPGNGNEN